MWGVEEAVVDISKVWVELLLQDLVPILVQDLMEMPPLTQDSVVAKLQGGRLAEVDRVIQLDLF
jgi:hypothetical protein